MSLRLVNVVGTRAVRGEHQALLAWYTDHVHQLMAFEGLEGAVLHRRQDATGVVAPPGAQAAAPEYLCLYDFASRAAFEAYEQSPVHADAARDRQLGWGRDGIEITLREAFERLHTSQTAMGLDAAGPAGNAGVAPIADPIWAPQSVEAWVAPRQAAFERALSARCVASASARFSLLRAVPQTPKVADYLVVQALPARPTMLDATAIATATATARLAWQAQYQALRQWRR